MRINGFPWALCHISTEFCENQFSNFCVILLTDKHLYFVLFYYYYYYYFIYLFIIILFIFIYF